MALTPWLSHFKTDFELARRRRQESIAFDALRCEAFDRFLLLGCPTPADEHWRFIDITPIAETNFTLGAEPSRDASADQTAASPFGGGGDIVLTFVNGYFVRDASKIHGLPDGALVAPLKSVLGSDAPEPGSYFAQIARVDCLPFVALNTALFEDGACIAIPPNTTIDRPIHLRFICNGESDAKPAMTQPRALIVVGDHSAATVVESYAGADVGYFTNAVTEVVLGDGAQLQHQRLQHESAAAYHISAAHVVVARGAMYLAQSTNTGGVLARSETMVLLAGEHARCVIDASSEARSASLVNVHTAIDHAAANCVSRQRCNWTLGDNAVGVASGRTVVRADAHNCRVRHANRALLLSPTARIDVKPAFEILAKEFAFARSSRVVVGSG